MGEIGLLPLTRGEGLFDERLCPADDLSWIIGGPIRVSRDGVWLEVAPVLSTGMDCLLV